MYFSTHDVCTASSLEDQLFITGLFLHHRTFYEAASEAVVHRHMLVPPSKRSARLMIMNVCLLSVRLGLPPALALLHRQHRAFSWFVCLLDGLSLCSPTSCSKYVFVTLWSKSKRCSFLAPICESRQPVLYRKLHKDLHEMIDEEVNKQAGPGY